MADSVALNLSDDEDALRAPQEPIQSGPTMRRTRSRATQENPAEEIGPNKRRKVTAKSCEPEEDKGNTVYEDEGEEEEDEEEVAVEGETPAQKQERVERKRADTLGLKLEVPIWIEFLKDPHKKDKKGNLIPVKGTGKGDYDAPYTALRLRVYQHCNRIKWVKEDIARHMGRNSEEINWSLVKYCDQSASRSSYQLVGATQKEWGDTFKDWTKNPKNPKAIALLMTQFPPPVEEQPEAPPKTENEAPVAGKANPLRNLTVGTFQWRKQLEDAHPIGECATHPKACCARRGDLHFLLKIPQFTAWACHLNKNPTASLIEPPPIPLFNSIKAARGGASSANQAETSVTAGTLAPSSDQPTSQAIQLATLALLTQLMAKPANVVPNLPISIANPAPQQAQYGSVANRYLSAPSLGDFCKTYGLKESEDKLKKLGFRPGDTPQGLEVVTADDLKDAEI